MPSQILLFSVPRTGCHLLERMIISKQPNVNQLWHPFSTASPGNDFSAWLDKTIDGKNPEDVRLACAASQTVTVEKWRLALTDAQGEGKALYMHDHVMFAAKPEATAEVLGQPLTANRRRSNFTAIPDDLLLHPGTVPIFTIRHPILFVPSTYKAIQAVAAPTSQPARATYIAGGPNLGWNRELYDWYVDHGVRPIVLDADDYMTSEDFVRHICSSVGLDPDNAVVSWPKASEAEVAEMHPQLRKIQETLLNSQGLVSSRASINIDLDAEKRSWKETFSEAEVELLTDLVEAAMPHYEHLQQNKLRM